MFPVSTRARRLWSAAAVSLLSAALALPDRTLAQTSNQVLPPVTVDAPANAPRARQKQPPRRGASTARRARPAAQPPQAPAPSQGDASSATASLNTPPIKQRYQLPQTSESTTAAEVQRRINVVDTEDAVKYMPSLFVRKRNNGDTQPVLATRTSGVGA